MLSKKTINYLDEKLPNIVREIFECIDDKLDIYILKNKDFKDLDVGEKLEAIEYVLNEIKKTM